MRIDRYLLFTLLMVLTLVGLVAGSNRSVEAQQGPPDPPDDEEPSFTVPEEARFAPGEIVVKRAPETSEAEIAALNRSNNARTEEEIPGTRISVIDLPPDLPVERAAEIYERSPAVEHAEPNFLLFPTATPNDDFYPSLWNLENTNQNVGTPDADIDANLGWEVTTGSQETIVAVIDTGVDRFHEDLENNIWVNSEEANGLPGVDDDGNSYVDDVHGWDFYNNDNTVYDPADGEAHGTHVAGTIAAVGNNDAGVVGVNWQARIMVLKFLGPNGGFLADAVEAIDYALDKEVKISNNSWGCTGDKQDPEDSCYSEILRDKIREAGDGGHLFVAAAGNNGSNNDRKPRFFPASYANPNIISVAATNSKDQLASFSNYGDDTVDLGAPGVRILSTFPEDDYGYLNGTSMAAPHVTGTAALLKSKNVSLSDEEIKRQVLRTVEKKRSLQGKTVTNGRLNAAAALGVGPTELTLGANPRITVFRNATTLSGRLTTLSGRPLSGRKVVIRGRTVGANSFRKYGEVTTNSEGRYALRDVKPFKRTYFRAHFGGNQADGLEGDVSPGQRVDVRAKITLRTDGSQLKLGNSRGMGGKVYPDHPRADVKIIVKRNGNFVEQARVPLDSNSRYHFTYKPERTGKYSFFAVFPGDGDHLTNRSRQKSFKVVR